MSENKTSKSGVFVEYDENGHAVRVVESQPERGVQLVAPGGEITGDAQAQIDRVKADLSGAGVVRGGPVPAPDPVSNETVASKSKRA